MKNQKRGFKPLFFLHLTKIGLFLQLYVKCVERRGGMIT